MKRKANILSPPWTVFMWSLGWKAQYCGMKQCCVKIYPTGSGIWIGNTPKWKQQTAGLLTQLQKVSLRAAAALVHIQNIILSQKSFQVTFNGVYIGLNNSWWQCIIISSQETILKLKCALRSLINSKLLLSLWPGPVPWPIWMICSVKRQITVSKYVFVPQPTATWSWWRLLQILRSWMLYYRYCRKLSNGQVRAASYHATLASQGGLLALPSFQEALEKSAWSLHDSTLQQVNAVPHSSMRKPSHTFRSFFWSVWGRSQLRLHVSCIE